MEVRPGDEILVAARNLGQPERKGTVVEVEEQNGRQRLSVDWEDGHRSIWMPHGLFKVVGHKPDAAETAR